MSKWDDLLQRVKGIGNLRARVGVLRETGGESEGGGASLALIALANEFGTEDGHVPERSYLRRTLREKRAELNAKRKAAVKAIVTGGADAKKELGKIGMWLAGQVRATIRSSVPPPNAPSTIARKGSETTLVDEGRLINSISSVVEEAER